jgi:hypothetical protein
MAGVIFTLATAVALVDGVRKDGGSGIAGWLHLAVQKYSLQEILEDLGKDLERTNAAIKSQIELITKANNHRAQS